jgi:hypothetical protein
MVIFSMKNPSICLTIQNKGFQMISTWHVNLMDFKIHQNKENGNTFTT